MKLEKIDHTIVTQGLTSNSVFTIEASSKAFEILAGLYPVPIKAIIRELSTNSFDSHVEKGCPDRPFHVSLPTWISPEFKIRDYGISMTDEKVEKLYTRAFYSDKTNSNELNGQLGLGRLSVTCYSRSFNLTTFLNGKKSIYVIYLNEDDMPTLGKYGTFDTEEEDGVEVSFCVRKEDVNAFYQHAADVYSAFRVQPIINNSNYKPKPRKYLHETANFGLRTSDHFTGCYAMMGNIAYKLDPYQLGFKADSPEYKLLSMSVDLFFAIGELNIVPSRESLKTTPKTVANIKSKIDEVINEFNTYVLQDKLKGVATYVDFCTVMNKLKGEFGSLLTAYTTEKFNGKLAAKELFIPRQILVNNVATPTTPLQYCGQSQFVSEQTRYNIYATHSVELDNKNTIFLDDDLQSKTRRKFYYNSTIENSKNIGSDSYLLDPKNPEHKALLDQWDRPDRVISLKSCPNPPKLHRRNGSLTRVRDQINVVQQHKSLICWKFVGWSKADIDQQTLVLYAVGHRNCYVTSTLNWHDAKKAFDQGFIDRPLYVIKSYESKKIVNNPNWVEFSTYVMEKARAALKGKEQDIADYILLSNDKRYCILPLLPANTDPLIDNIVNTYKTLEKSSKTLSEWVSTLDIRLPKATISAELDAIYAKYPFFNVIDTFDLTDKKRKSHILNTISLIK